MSDLTTPNAADFPLIRKGYDVDQVDQALARLTAARDEAWQRLAGLGDEMRALERRLMDLREAQQAAEATVPDFEVLSPRAAGLLVTAEDEAEAVRSDAVQEANRIDSAARTDARRSRTTAGEFADRLRAAADESHRRELERARAQAEALRAEADRETRAIREATTAHAEEAGARAETASREAHAWLAGQQRAADQEFAAHDVKVLAWEDEIVAVGDRKLAEVDRHLKAMQVKAEQIEADAATQAERRLEKGRRDAERIAEQSAREETAFAERRDLIQSQLDHIRETLTALTGTVTPEDPAPAESDSEADTSELPTLPQAVDNAED
ncbi:coiled-coil domain-containing protein [Streptacidiphilus rugosus]|uniref:hypothetical protein n=1 Tax=Streptacidiphilus rugosus TaxID=405783 RepID=UPI00056C1D98|nr:hypothetical protein [Streptacidiphilus rugosus]